MMEAFEIGTYLDRRILLQAVNSPRNIETSDLSNAATLLWIAREVWEAQHFSYAIQKLIRAKPLSIIIAGHNADYGFTTLLEILSFAPNDDAHIITGIIDGESNDLSDTISEFLISTYPDEKRFDEWKEYYIFAVGLGNIRDQVVHSIRNAIKISDAEN